jgi:cytochrome c oxidase cbb3-type subunit 1/cytochrome c oxidase cbb3-type subunit I/II
MGQKIGRFKMKAEVTNRGLVKFIVAGVLFFAWVMIQGAVMEQEAVHAFLQLGPAGMITGAHSHLGCVGWAGLILAAVVYYLVPVLSGKSIIWPRLINWIFWLWVIDTAVLAILMIIAGITGGNATAAGLAIPQVMAMLVPYYVAMGILAIVGGIVGVMFTVQILVSLAVRGPKAAS